MCKNGSIYIIFFVALVVVLLCVLTACRTVATCVPETITRDSIRVQHVLDSVYLYERDSIFVHAKADTVWVERWKTRYKDVLRIQRDTIRDTRTETQVKQVRYVPKYYRFTSWAFWIVLAVILIRLAWWVAKKLYGR